MFLTYPFVDAVVGTNPAQARNLHMGDYTNLSAQLDLDLGNLQLPVDPKVVCQVVPELGKKLCGDALDAALACVNKLAAGKLGDCTQGLVTAVCDNVPKQFPDICGQVPTGPVLTQLDRCLASGDPTSAACRDVADLDAACADPRYQGQSRVPAAPAAVDARAAADGPGRAGADTDPAQRRRAAEPARVRRGRRLLTGPDGRARTTGADSDLGALLVWGMVQR